MTWTKRESKTTENLNGVTLVGSRLVTIGERGTILTSDDGVTWTKRDSKTLERLNDVGGTKDDLVVVGERGTILTTDNNVGIPIEISIRPPPVVPPPSTIKPPPPPPSLPFPGYYKRQWKRKRSGGDVYLHSVTWTGERYVVVGAEGVILTSKDGNSWKRRQAGIGVNVLENVTWTGERLIAVAQRGNILTSERGFTWELRQSGVYKTLFHVCWGGDGAVIVGEDGDLLTSGRGLVWARRNSRTDEKLFACWGNGKNFIVAGEAGLILTSFDSGVTWEKRKSVDVGSARIWDVGNSDTIIVAVAEGGRIVTSEDNGVTWTKRDSGTTDHLYSITWTGKEFWVAGANSTILVSPDGINWYDQSIAGPSWLRDIHPSIDDKLIVVGTGGYIYIGEKVFISGNKGQ